MKLGDLEILQLQKDNVPLRGPREFHFQGALPAAAPGCPVALQMQTGSRLVSGGQAALRGSI